MVSSSLIVFLIATALANVYGETLNVTSSATDYYLQSQRDMLIDCDTAQIQIDSVNARYADQLSVIQLQQGYLLDDIQNVNKTYTSQQALNINKKHCIQKNELQFITFNSANSRLLACYQPAATVATTLTKTATSDLTVARNAALVTLPRAINTCNTSYAANKTQLEECYVKEVTAATKTCNNYLYNVRIDLNKSLYDASVATNTAVKCSFAVEKDVLASMGKTEEAIRVCEQTLIQQGNRSALAEVQQKNVQPPVVLKKLIGP